jgi:putative Holliday junction resolvase
MSRILAIDYGLKRCGIAVTDPLQMIASPLETVATGKLLDYLKKYDQREEVESMVIGIPFHGDGSESEIASNIRSFIRVLGQHFPTMAIHEVDERFTSKIAMDTLIRGGMKKKDRRNKGNIDKVSAALILRSFMEQNK